VDPKAEKGLTSLGKKLVPDF